MATTIRPTKMLRPVPRRNRINACRCCIVMLNPLSSRLDGWGISLDVSHANFVPEPCLSQCHYVLGVPLDCDGVLIASR
jgi:hypothetical protein